MKTPLRFGSILNIRVHSIWILNNWGIAIQFLTLSLSLSLSLSLCLPLQGWFPWSLSHLHYFPLLVPLGGTGRWAWAQLDPRNAPSTMVYFDVKLRIKGFEFFFFFFLIGFKIFICFGELWTFELMVWKLEIDDFVPTKRHEFSEIGDK